MENIKIWHTPDEKPEDRPIIEHWKNKLGRDCYNLWYVSCAAQLGDDTVKWAYLEDLVATSKALDVAIKSLKEIGNNASYTNEAFGRKIADRALDKITEIMKGVKQ